MLLRRRCRTERDIRDIQSGSDRGRLGKFRNVLPHPEGQVLVWIQPLGYFFALNYRIHREIKCLQAVYTFLCTFCNHVALNHQLVGVGGKLSVCLGNNVLQKFHGVYSPNFETMFLSIQIPPQTIPGFPSHSCLQ